MPPALDTRQLLRIEPGADARCNGQNVVQTTYLHFPGQRPAPALTGDAADFYSSFESSQNARFPMLSAPVWLHEVARQAAAIRSSVPSGTESHSFGQPESPVDRAASSISSFSPSDSETAVQPSGDAVMAGL